MRCLAEDWSTPRIQREVFEFKIIPSSETVEINLPFGKVQLAAYFSNQVLMSGNLI